MVSRRRRPHLLLLLSLACLALPGCGARTSSVSGPEGTPTPAAATPNAWLGHTAEEVAEVYGEPYRQLDGPDGSGILYIKRLDLDAVIDENQPSSQMKLAYEAKFWLDRQGKVYRVWMEPAAVKTHYRPPPQN